MKKIEFKAKPLSYYVALRKKQKAKAERDRKKGRFVLYEGPLVSVFWNIPAGYGHVNSRSMSFGDEKVKLIAQVIKVKRAGK